MRAMFPKSGGWVFTPRFLFWHARHERQSLVPLKFYVAIRDCARQFGMPKTTHRDFLPTRFKSLHLFVVVTDHAPVWLFIRSVDAKEPSKR